MNFYKILFSTILLVTWMNATELTHESNDSAGSLEETSLWEGHDQYLFLQFSLSPQTEDSFEWGTDIEEEEKEVGLVYYLQINGPFYAKGSLGKATYSYTESYISSGTLIEQRDAKFNYIQAGAALALYEDRLGIITADIEYMKPFHVSATKETYGIVTSMKQPNARVIVSCNGNFCVNQACFGLGVSNTRYDDSLLFSLRIGARF